MNVHYVPLSARRQGMAINQPHGTVAAVRAQELVYGLPLPPETLTKLAAVAQRLNRPLDDLMREAIARTWLADAPPPTDADPSSPGVIPCIPRQRRGCTFRSHR